MTKNFTLLIQYSVCFLRPSILFAVFLDLKKKQKKNKITVCFSQCESFCFFHSITDIQSMMNFERYRICSQIHQKAKLSEKAVDSVYHSTEAKSII